MTGRSCVRCADLWQSPDAVVNPELYAYVALELGRTAADRHEETAF